MSKKVDVTFMRFVMNDADWKREVLDAGDKVLCVIDVYDKLWGPCEMMAGHLSNFFFDLGEKYGIKFVRAQVNTVDELKEFKDQAEPHFLIYLNGEKLELIPGADIPKIKGAIETKAPPAK